MEVMIFREGKPAVRFDVGVLGVVALVGQAYGYEDIDVETFPEKVTIRAKNAASSFTATGATLVEAANRFLDRLTS
jgi:hypothetical protein